MVTCSRQIRAIGSSEYKDLSRKYEHYVDRWEYHSKVCDIATELIAAYGLRTAIELGPLWKSCIVNADVIDIRDVTILDPGATLYRHDAGTFPWPVEKRYDLFIGLQVFEHLNADLKTGRRLPERDGVQKSAFEEVRKIAAHAIISLPIGWRMDDPSDCHHEIREEEALSWFLPNVPTRVVVGSGGPRTRMIYVFENINL